MRRKLSAGNHRPVRTTKKRKFSIPALLFEFQPEYILGARFARSHRTVENVAQADLEAGALLPLLARSNFLNPEELAGKVSAVAGVLGSDKGPIGLLLPDGAVRVSILDFETLPADRKEQKSLVRWKMKSLLPYPVEEARISFDISAREPEGVQAVVMAIRKSVLEEYESTVDGLSGRVSLVLPTSAALLPLLSEETGQGEMLLNISPAGLTVVVASGGQIRLWRNQTTAGKSSAEALSSIGEEAVRTLAASHDRYGLDVSLVRVCARPGVSPDWMEALGRTLSRDVDGLVPDSALAGSKLSYEEGRILSEFGATISGLAANA